MKLTKGGRKDIYNHVTKDVQFFLFIHQRILASTKILRNVYTGWTEDTFPSYLNGKKHQLLELTPINIYTLRTVYHW